VRAGQHTLASLAAVATAGPVPANMLGVARWASGVPDASAAFSHDSACISAVTTRRAIVRLDGLRRSFMC